VTVVRVGWSSSHSSEFLSHFPYCRVDLDETGQTVPRGIIPLGERLRQVCKARERRGLVSQAVYRERHHMLDGRPGRRGGGKRFKDQSAQIGRQCSLTVRRLKRAAPQASMDGTLNCDANQTGEGPREQGIQLNRGSLLIWN